MYLQQNTFKITTKSSDIANLPRLWHHASLLKDGNWGFRHPVVKGRVWGTSSGMQTVWPVNTGRVICRYQTRQIWGIWKLRPAYSPETPNLGQNRWCFVPCDLEIWWMTLENNRASLLCCFKLCATFHSHRWIQTGVTVRKRAIWVKFDDI